MALNQNLSSTSVANPSGFKNPEVDALLLQLRATDDAAEQQQLLNDIQAIWDQQMPGVILSQQPELIGWNEKVHGITPTIASMVLFHDAFITQ